MHACALAQNDQIITEATGDTASVCRKHEPSRKHLIAPSCSQPAGLALSWEEYELNRSREFVAGSGALRDRLPAVSELHGLAQLHAAEDFARALQEGSLDLMALIEREP